MNSVDERVDIRVGVVHVDCDTDPVASHGRAYTASFEFLGRSRHIEHHNGGAVVLNVQPLAQSLEPVLWR